MTILMKVGVCCMLLSVWGSVQLTIMGALYYYQTPTLFENCEPEEYTDYNDFIQKTKENYTLVAINCLGAAGMYALTLLISICCIIGAKRRARRAALLLEDDEYFCQSQAKSVIRQREGL